MKLLISILLCLANTIAYADNVIQKTEGWCSPAVANISGDVFITCNGVSPKALKKLNDILEKKNLALEEKINEANSWSQRYIELKKNIESSLGDKLAKKALGLLEQGELEKAGEIFDKLIKENEENIKKSAEYHSHRGQIFALQFKKEEALKHLKKAYEYGHDFSPVYIYQYSLYLKQFDNIKKSSALYVEFIEVLKKDIEKIDPDAFTILEALVSIDYAENLFKSKSYDDVIKVADNFIKLVDEDISSNKVIATYIEESKNKDFSVFTDRIPDALYYLGASYYATEKLKKYKKIKNILGKQISNSLYNRNYILLNVFAASKLGRNNKFEDAIKSYNEALKYIYKANNNISDYKIWFKIARLYRLSSNKKLSIKYYEKVANKLNHKSDIDNMYYAISHFYIGRLLEKKPNESLESFKKSLPYLERTIKNNEDTKLNCKAYNISIQAIAEYYREKQDLINKDIFKLLNEGVEIMKKYCINKT